ncbi:MAG: hypothetical protein JWO03_1525 [Bacteroidetes bacterium]|nr:hypothetical protein [Bacteroidota bacterium]
MEFTENSAKPINSKGALIFKKMLEDKKAIHEYLKQGGKLADLKSKYRFANPLSSSRNK